MVFSPPLAAAISLASLQKTLPFSSLTSFSFSDNVNLPRSLSRAPNCPSSQLSILMPSLVASSLTSPTSMPSLFAILKAVPQSSLPLLFSVCFISSSKFLLINSLFAAINVDIFAPCKAAKRQLKFTSDHHTKASRCCP